MASITGVTLARMLKIRDDTIVSARVVNGELLFTKGDLVTEFSVGSIIRPPIDAWPVGSIFMNVSATNPKTLLGVPSSSPVTWARWGMGRMPISLAEGNNRYNTPERAEGAEFVQLAISQVPAHSHGGITDWQDRDHTHTGYAHGNGAHTHDYTAQYTAPQTASGASNYYTGRGPGTTSSAGHHDHYVTTNEASQSHRHGITSEGGGGFHENMPPFITVYMWKRTA